MISLLLPTRKRPDRLLRTIQSVTSTATHMPQILCYVSDCDDSYDSMICTAGQGFAQDVMRNIIPDFIRGPRLTMSDLWNALIPHAKGDIFQLTADDVIYRTPGWDVEIEKAFAAVPDKILLAYADDGGPNGKNFASLPFVSRRWVETVGYFTGPGFSADFSDTWPNDVADMIGRKKFVPVLIEHMHYIWSKAEEDQTYKENQERWHRDRPDKLYAERLPERIRDAEKLRKAMSA